MESSWKFWKVVFFFVIVHIIAVTAADTFIKYRETELEKLEKERLRLEIELMKIYLKQDKNHLNQIDYEQLK